MPSGEDAAAVIVYADAHFRGASQVCGLGAYNLSDLTVGDDAISSVRVQPGYKVTLFQQADFQGLSRTFTIDAPWVGADDFNDMTSSIRVEELASEPAPSAGGGLGSAPGVDSRPGIHPPVSPVEYAAYGVWDATRDATGEVRKAYAQGARHFEANNDWVGDPRPGERKYLYLVWEHNGALCSGVVGEGDATGIDVP
jgi:hypothetical protein